MKTILVCCGSGVATSPQVANKINEFLADHDLDNVAQELILTLTSLFMLALHLQTMIYAKPLKQIT